MDNVHRLLVIDRRSVATFNSDTALGSMTASARRRTIHTQGRTVLICIEQVVDSLQLGVVEECLKVGSGVVLAPFGDLLERHVVGQSDLLADRTENLCVQVAVSQESPTIA
jgi:hypothetical protein